MKAVDGLLATFATWLLGFWGIQWVRGNEWDLMGGIEFSAVATGVTVLVALALGLIVGLIALVGFGIGALRP